MSPSAPDQNLQEHQPERVLRAFQATPLAVFLVVALVLHVILIFGSSVGYIRDIWIDPEGARKRAEEAAAAAAPKVEIKARQDKPKPASAKPADGKPADGKPADAAKPADPLKDVPADAKDSKQVKDITSMPKPGETPATPNEDKLLDLDRK